MRAGVIGKLKGVIDSYGEDHVIVDVHGVGYVVLCSAKTLSALPPAGEAAVLSIETQVREDAIRLFGFRTDAEREWFRLLQTVQGVGSKVALGILSALDPGGLATAIGTQDKAMVARSPGVGPKLAARIVAELKDKAPGLRPASTRRLPASPGPVKRPQRARPVAGRRVAPSSTSATPGPGPAAVAARARGCRGRTAPRRRSSSGWG